MREHKPIKFDTFGKIDKKMEETYHEVENMSNKELTSKALHTSFVEAAIWAICLNLIKSQLRYRLRHAPIYLVFNNLILSQNL